jgi:hypothetical protein
MKESSARLASAFEMPAPSAIASTNSALFMVYGLMNFTTAPNI